MRATCTHANAPTRRTLNAYYYFFRYPNSLAVFDLLHRLLREPVDFPSNTLHTKQFHYIMQIHQFTGVPPVHAFQRTLQKRHTTQTRSASTTPIPPTRHTNNATRARVRDRLARPEVAAMREHLQWAHGTRETAGDVPAEIHQVLCAPVFYRSDADGFEDESRMRLWCVRPIPLGTAATAASTAAAAASESPAEKRANVHLVFPFTTWSVRPE